MKFMRYFSLFTFIIFFTFFFCNGSQEEKVKKLRDYVTDDINQLREFFNNQQFEAMANLLGARSAVLITPAYQKIFGKDSASFWKEVWNRNVGLEFSIVKEYESGAIGEKEIKIEEKSVTLNKVGIVVLKISIITQEQDSILKNDGLFGVLFYRHTVQCPWY